MLDNAGTGDVDVVAVVVVRDGVLAAGSLEAIAEAGWHTIVIGTGTAEAALSLGGHVWTIEVGPWAVGAYASLVVAALQRIEPVAGATVVLPASPDGRDLAPRVASLLQRQLVAPCVRVTSTTAQRVRTAGRVVEVIRLNGPIVTTLLPGVRGVEGDDARPPLRIDSIALAALSTSRAAASVSPPANAIGATETGAAIAAVASGFVAVGDAAVGPTGGGPEARTVAVDPPDPATADLREAPRVVAGGKGLGSAERFAQLGRIGNALGASLGGTRVASDAGWISFERQIGTTGVAINPRVYLAFAISGATQHTTGLGSPEHIISVNTDPSCPMMTMADVAIVSDANEVLNELEKLLSHE